MNRFTPERHKEYQEQKCEEEPDLDNSTAHWMGRCALISWIDGSLEEGQPKMPKEENLAKNSKYIALRKPTQESESEEDISDTSPAVTVGVSETFLFRFDTREGSQLMGTFRVKPPAGIDEFPAKLNSLTRASNVSIRNNVTIGEASRILHENH